MFNFSNVTEALTTFMNMTTHMMANTNNTTTAESGTSTSSSEQEIIARIFAIAAASICIVSGLSICGLSLYIRYNSIRKTEEDARREFSSPLGNSQYMRLI